MAEKHHRQQHLLHELLKEDQEPFLLKNYISERLTHLKKSPNNSSSKTSTTLQLKKQKHKQQQQIQSQNSTFPISLCTKTACFLSFHTTRTPDITKSPLFEPKSPCNSHNTVFLHIPAKTASILLEAALRIQKHSKPKTRDRANGFGLFGSIFKKLTNRIRTRKREIVGNSDNNVKVKDILRLEFESSVGRRKRSNDVVSGFTCSCNERPTGTCGQSYHETAEQNDAECGFFCESPFRFVLQTSSSSSPGRRTPEFPSPAPSPTRRRTEDKESNVADSNNKFQSGEEEEEKEQCSPVSVLDPPFEDDDDVHEDEDLEDGFDMECSYANVQRAKQQLLYKLHRFEKLAELDPVELEKRMLLDQEDDEYESLIEEGDSEYNDSETSEEELIDIVFEVLYQSSCHGRRQVPKDLKRLVTDLILEEERELSSSEDRDMVIRRVCRRLELWKEVESNTIDMMIEDDFSREECVWKKNAEQTRGLAEELELAIFGFLMEEFSEELVC